jgi:hypothetical protein
MNPVVRLDKMSPDVVRKSIHRARTNEDVILLDHHNGNSSPVRTNGVLAYHQETAQLLPTKSFYGKATPAIEAASALSTEPERKEFKARPTAVASKPPHRQVKWYWMGKDTLKQWHNLAIKRYEAELPSSRFIEAEPSRAEALNDEASANNDVQEIIMCEGQEVATIPSSNSTTAAVVIIDSILPATTLNFFNEDIVCPHNKLSPTTNKRLINAEAWRMIYEGYFQSNGSNYVFTENSDECYECQVNKKPTAKSDLLAPDLVNRSKNSTVTVIPCK